MRTRQAGSTLYQGQGETGRYRATVRTPLMEALSMPAVERDIATHSDAGVDSVASPTVRKALEAACPNETVGAGEGMLHGRARNERSQAIADGIVTIVWKAYLPLVATRSDATIGMRDK